MKKALITGNTGQDGSYLAEFLLFKGYEVHGILRRASTFNTHRVDHIYVDPHSANTRFFLHYGDLSDSGQLVDLIYNIKPDEIYHLGAQSHVRVSFDMPEYTGDIDALGTTRLLEAIRHSKIKTRFYQASSSEMFGSAVPPQSEVTCFEPRSPYACAKAYSFWMVVNYRTGYNLFACNGILFNHESPRRGETFVTRKITRGIADILSGRQKTIFLGNLNAKRDWGYSPEYVEVMWLMLQQEKAKDYVIGTGEAHSVREFISEAFKYVGIELEWEGKGLKEKGIVQGYNNNFSKQYSSVSKGDCLIQIDARYFRPTEVDFLLADNNKARLELKWEPKIKFNDLIKIMVDYDFRLSGLESKGDGVKISKNKGFIWTNHDYSFYSKIK